MMPGSKRWLVLLGVLGLACAARMAAAGWWQHRLGDPYAFSMPDTLGYWELGQRIAEGRPYEYAGQVSRTPGYPLLLAALFSLFGTDAPLVAARAIGAILGTFAVAGVAWLANTIFPPRGDSDTQPVRIGTLGLVAGGLAAIYPGAIAMSIFVLSEALFCPLMILHLVGWVKATQTESTRACTAWSVFGGVAAGLAILTRPSWLLFTPFVLVLLVMMSPNRRRHFHVGAWLVLTICLTMVPWWVRNYRAVGHFVPTTLTVGASLYDGLHPDATGASDMSFSTRFHRTQKREDSAAGRSADEFEVRLDHRLRDAALSWAARHPERVLKLMGRKFLRMWNVWPNADQFQSLPLRLIVFFGYVPLLILGIVGAWQWCRTGWPMVLCLLPAVYFTCLHVVFVGSIRYRQPAMLVWLILAAAVIDSGWRRFKSRAPVEDRI